MGIEFRLRFKHASQRELEDAVRRLPFFLRFHEPERMFDLGGTQQADPRQMPAAFVVVEDDGFYFCDNGGAREIKEALLTIARQYDAEISIEEL